MTETISKIDTFGDQCWFRILNNDELSTNNFAGIQIDKWYPSGVYHRTDGPAIICSAAECNLWYVDGKFMRTNEDYQDAVKLTNEEMCMLILKYGNVDD